MPVLMTPSDKTHLLWLQDVAFKVPQRVLDIGCGSGFLCQTFKNKGSSFALGIDIEIPPHYDEKKESWQFMSIDLVKPLWEKKVEQTFPGSFDAIFAFDILEHLPSPWDFLHSCKNLLAKEGKLFLTTPNIQSLERRLNPHHWSGVRDPQHKILFNAYSLEFLLSKVGFRIEYKSSPIRSLAFLQKTLPMLGGQLFYCVSLPS